MAAIEDPEVLEAIKKLGEHFQTNVNNRYMHDVFVQLDVSDSDWRLIERLTSPRQIDDVQGYGVEQLYDGIISLAHFIYAARREAVPAISNFIHHGTSPIEKMAIKNFPSNLSSLSQMVYDLYKKVRGQANDAPRGRHFEELSRVEHYLGK
jgi:CO dehydrogenase/acetyl-CoA synthase epsilon subunit